MESQLETISQPNPPVSSSGGNQCVILDHVSWDLYERLLAEHNESSGTHFTYDQGRLEIMVLSVQHEALKHALEVLVRVFAEEMNVDVYGIASTTLRRVDLQRGFEPDACFYLVHAPLVRGKKEINLATDPPPDLVIEIDITNPSLNKLPIFAAVGISEVWHYDGAQLTILTLAEGQYVKEKQSSGLPGVTVEALERFVETAQELPSPAWLRSIREWARAHLTKSA